MATITLYSNKINQMPELINDIKNSVNDYKTNLFSIKSKSLTINKSVCDLDDVISSIQSSSQTQEEKIASLEAFKNDYEEFVSDVKNIDDDVADVIKERKNDFYEEYYYLKPECEKNEWEKFTDTVSAVCDWCKEHWKLVVTIVIVIAAIVVIAFFPAAAPFLLLAAKGAIAGALTGGIMGGISSLAAGGSFLEGFENGAFQGAITGAIFGGIGGAGQMLGSSCRVLNALGNTAKIIPHIARISGGITAVMGGFDMLAFGIGLLDPTNPIVILNQNLHSNKFYNAFQIGVSALAVFTAGFSVGMRNPTCFVAGTMILTAAGFVAIENIRAGDKVISTNEETFEIAEKTVVETYIRETRQLVHLTINGELLKTTADHPFFVEGHGFINAGELKAGDKVISSKAGTCLIENINLEIAESPITVYNFQVEDFHTYHVGEIGVLVHNADGQYGQKHTPEQQALIKEGRGYEKAGSVTRDVADDFVNRCYEEGFTNQQVRIDEGHMLRTDPTTPMPGISGGPHLHCPFGKKHSIPIIDLGGN